MTEIYSLGCNPFLESFNTPHQTVPFDKISLEHFEPAIKEGIRQHESEIDGIANSPSEPDFENTIVALEKSGQLLSLVSTVFENLNSAETSDAMQELALRLAPELSKHQTNISLNERLFERVRFVYENQTRWDLNEEQKRLLEITYQSFVRSGANLKGEKKDKYRQLTQDLSMATLKFSENVLKETNDFKLHLINREDLAGLPDGIVETAAEAAFAECLSGWVFTLHAPSYVPFMTYSDRRDLREQMYRAYNTRCICGNACDNTELVRQIVNLRREIAQLLDYHCHADFVLKRRMAENSTSVYYFLNQLLEAYAPAAHEEVNAVLQLAREQMGGEFELMPWDWAYFSNKLKDRRYNISEELLRPYFNLEQVKKGVFGLATRLYGVSFRKNTDIPVYHPDVEAFEVYDKDGSFLAVLYTDFYPRAGKRPGAWMTEYKGQWKDCISGENSRPHVSLVMNFTKPVGDKPALLTFNEVETFLHEFGHSLHGIFADSTYESLSGTNVYWDFVELPSQLMENFAIQPEFLNTFAFHYQTGEQIPADYVQRLVDAANFNVGYACLRQLSFGLLDMAWHTLTEPFDGDIRDFERNAWARTQLLPVVPETCMSVQFSHIFAGGYSAGYYSYKWAEVLDADAFSLFKQCGIFSSKVAESFRKNVLSKGNTEPPMELYRRFRGQEPTIQALLVRNGILKKEDDGYEVV